MKIRWSVVSAASAVLLLLPVVASAQYGLADIGDAFQPDYLRRDMVVVAEVLDLDETQQEILSSLYGDYEQAFREGSNALRETLTSFRTTPGALERERLQLDEAIRTQLETLAAELRQNQSAAVSDDERQALFEEFRREARELRETMTSFEAKIDPNKDAAGGAADAEREVSEWRAEKTHLADEFAANVRAILNAPQVERWPVVEQTLRRQKSLPKGRLSGESVDLVLLAGDLQLQPEDRMKVEAVLSDYAAAMDEALRNRDETIADAKYSLAEAYATANGGSIGDVIDEVFDRRVAVRDLHAEYARRITAVLPTDRTLEFATAVALDTHPRVYRPTQAERVLDAAMRMPDLTELERDVVSALRTEFLGRIEAMNGELARAIWQREPDQLREAEKARFKPVDLEAGDMGERDAVQEAFLLRQREGVEYVKRLQQGLSKEHFAALPGALRLVDEESNQAEQAGLGSATPSDLFLRRFDKDGDGRLDARERSEAHRVIVRERLRK